MKEKATIEKSGWPRKNEGLRVYYEGGQRAYLLMNPERERGSFDYEGVGEVMVDNDPSNPILAVTGISPMHIYQKCRRVEWSDMPEVWKSAFLEWLEREPEEIRGLWRLK